MEVLFRVKEEYLEFLICEAILFPFLRKTSSHSPKDLIRRPLTYQISHSSTPQFHASQVPLASSFFSSVEFAPPIPPLSFSFFLPNNLPSPNVFFSSSFSSLTSPIFKSLYCSVPKINGLWVFLNFFVASLPATALRTMRHQLAISYVEGET